MGIVTREDFMRRVGLEPEEVMRQMKERGEINWWGVRTVPSHRIMQIARILCEIEERETTRAAAPLILKRKVKYRACKVCSLSSY